MEAFCVELAGIPVEVRCRHPYNREFLAGYVTDAEPLLAVEPAEADLERAQEGFDRMDAADGVPASRRSDELLENVAIHALVAEGLVAHDVLLVHGSALGMDGIGVVFCATSGTGKSTHARLWREAFGGRVLMVNDDKPMVRVDEMRLYGTPWGGKHGLSSNASAPLGAIVALERGGENRIEPMGKADGFALLMRQCLRSRDPETMARIVEMERTLLDEAALFRLRCNTEPEAALVARDGMGLWGDGDANGGRA